MQLNGYYDLATKRFTPSLDSNTSIQLPPIVAGEDLSISVKFKRTKDGGTEEVRPTVNAMRAVLGQVDARPVSGKLILEVDGQPTAEFTYDPTAEAADGGTPFQTVLKNSLEGITGITSVTVERRFDSFIVRFADDATIQRVITVTKNTLFPSSFFRIREYLRGGEYFYEFRPVKAPVAFTNTFSVGYGSLPAVTSLRDGGAVDETAWSEIQSLYIPPSFTGTFRAKRGERRTDPLSRDSTLEEISDALAAIADEGGSFRVDSPIDSTAYIYFEGDMIGIDQPLIEIEIFDAPQVESIVEMTTKTRAMAELMMQVDQSVLFLEVYALLENLEDEDEEIWHCVLRQQLGVREAVDWEELATAPEIDWLNPPTLLRTLPFSPGQVSNGQIHYSTTFGDGIATSFAITHGLDTGLVDIIILENAAPGAKMIEGVDYTWVRNGDNLVTITWLTGTPDEDEYIVTVLGLAMTSFFDGHGHDMSEINGLAAWMQSVEDRLALLGALTNGRVTTETLTLAGEAARWQLPEVWELFPSRYQPTRPESGRLYDVDVNETAENGAQIIKRPKGLLPAIHDATVTSVTAALPALSTDLAGEVYQNNTGAIISVSGGQGLRSSQVKDGELIGCDGQRFYPVVPHNRYAGYAFTTDFADDATLLTFTSELAELLEVGKVCQLETTNTLPSGVSTTTDYYIRSINFETREVTLSATAGGEAIEFASNGTGVHTLVVVDSISYYPKAFERTLCTVHVNEKQMRSGKDFFIGLTLEAALLNATVDAQWCVFAEIGEPRELTGSNRGRNLEEVVWRALPALELPIVLSPISTQHTFGLRVTRRRVEGIDTLRAWRMMYGAEESGVVPPRTGNFSVRFRLGKFDTSDGETDQRGLLMLSGLALTEATTGDTETYELGYAVVK